MDALDVGILRTMDVRPYGERPKHPDALRPAHIARELGTTHVTVRERIARMEASGVISGYQVYPNLRHLGRASSALRFRVPDEGRKARAVAAAADDEEVFEVHDFMGPDVCIDITHEGPEALARATARLASATGDREPLRLYDRRTPAVSRALTNVDWRILRALRGQARRPLGEVADAIGLSLKTVRRHSDRMVAEGSFVAVPTLDLSRLRGVLPFFLNLHGAGGLTPGAVSAAMQAFADQRIHTYHPVDPRLGHVGFMLFATSVHDMDALRARALALPGVERAEAWVYRGWVERAAWIDRAIEARVSTPESRA